MTKVFVGNLSSKCTEDNLRKRFEEYGEVEQANIIYDVNTGHSRGFGYVTFSTESEAQDAIKKANGKEFMERELKVREDKKSGGGNKSSTSSRNYGKSAYGGGQKYRSGWNGDRYNYKRY